MRDFKRLLKQQPPPTFEEVVLTLVAFGLVGLLYVVGWAYALPA